jgi:hypothetical protein
MTEPELAAAYIAETIGSFLAGTGGEWDWDDFTSCSLPDERLGRIRRRAGAVPLPAGMDERATLLRLAEEAGQLASRPNVRGEEPAPSQVAD